MEENKQSEIAVISQKIETGLHAFEIRKADLTAKVEKYKGLTIKDADDKEGYLAVSAARKDLKAERVQIEKEGKSMRDPLTAISKTIKSKEDELVIIVSGPEDSLEKKEKDYLAEVQKIKDAADKAERDRIQGMYDELRKYNFPVTLDQLTNISDEHYQEALSHAKKAFEAEEQKRLQAEKEQEAARLKEEQRLKEEREEMARIKEQQDKTAREQKEAQEKIDKENKRIADEKAELERKEKERLAAIQREKDLDQARKEAAAKEKKRLEDEAAKKEQDRIAKENREKIAAEKKARLAPDREKFINFANQLSTIASVKVQFKNKESQDLFDTITNELSAMADDIKDKAEKL